MNNGGMEALKRALGDRTLNTWLDSVSQVADLKARVKTLEGRETDRKQSKRDYFASVRRLVVGGVLAAWGSVVAAIGWFATR